MPLIRLEIHITLPWCTTILHKEVPRGTLVATVLRDLAPLTRRAECLAVRQGKALLTATPLEADTQLTIVPLLCGG